MRTREKVANSRQEESSQQKLNPYWILMWDFQPLEQSGLLLIDIKSNFWLALQIEKKLYLQGQFRVLVIFGLAIIVCV